VKNLLRPLLGCTLLSISCIYAPLPLLAADVLQCVPYARALSGVAIRGDAWTWWDQAKGRYKRGREPRPGAVIALANTGAMPLGHVAVVSRILDDRHILVRHANWSGPGLIEEDVLAVDSSENNDWSQVRIWWGQSQQMGARNNPVNGFIYPERIGPPAVYAGNMGAENMESGNMAHNEGRQMLVAMAVKPVPVRVATAPRLKLDPSLFGKYRDTDVTGGRERSLDTIMAEVKLLALR